MRGSLQDTVLVVHQKCSPQRAERLMTQDASCFSGQSLFPSHKLIRLSGPKAMAVVGIWTTAT